MEFCKKCGAILATGSKICPLCAFDNANDLPAAPEAVLQSADPAKEDEVSRILGEYRRDRVAAKARSIADAVDEKSDTRFRVKLPDDVEFGEEPPARRTAQAAEKASIAVRGGVDVMKKRVRLLEKKAKELRETLPKAAEEEPAEAEEFSPADADVRRNRLWAALSYLCVLVVLPLLFARESPYVRFHANQGLLLLLFTVLSYILLTLLNLFTPFFAVLRLLLLVIAAVLMCYGIFNALFGRVQPMPLFGDLTLVK